MLSVCASHVLSCELTFVSTNLLIVARMSWWPETSSRDSGRYFSTLEASARSIIEEHLHTMVSCLRLQQAD